MKSEYLLVTFIIVTDFFSLRGNARTVVLKLSLEAGLNGGAYVNTSSLQPPAAVAADMVAAPAAGGIIQEAVAGDVDAPQRDFLDIVYKVILYFIHLL